MSYLRLAHVCYNVENFQLDLEYLRFGPGDGLSKILGFHSMRLNLTNMCMNMLFIFKDLSKQNAGC